MNKGKKYSDSLKMIDRTKQYDPEEAIDLVKQTAKAKFDETIEISVRLGVDPRHADQQVRGAVVLPNGTGKTVRVLAFVKENRIEEAKAAGADLIADDEIIKRHRKSEHETGNDTGNYLGELDREEGTRGRAA